MNYTILHLHSDYSSCTTNIDSVTKVQNYVDRAAECKMTSLAFTEHGNIYNWYEKKTAIEKAGMKYIHGVEAYITDETTNRVYDENGDVINKVRDNRHCILLAKNYKGFLELNKLVTNSYIRTDNIHFYYTPRITMQELENTSDNIIVTTACVGGVLGEKTSQILYDRILKFIILHKDRCYLEVQHHFTPAQIQHNKKMVELSERYGLKLVAGTDTHSLNEELADARIIFQKGKGVEFSQDEDGWDMTFKTYDELISAFKRQSVLTIEQYTEAIENTNKIAKSIESFEINKNTKYPKLYEDSVSVFRKMVYDSVETHPYALKNHTREEIYARIEEELPVYEKTQTIDFMIFEKMVADWEREHGIYRGDGRGSVTGSFIAYLLRITNMDSISFNLNFFRFLNPNRVSNCDIDVDYYSEDRERVAEFLLTNPKIKAAKIITFQTVALKGAIREIGRALEMPLEEVDEISKNIETSEDKYRKKYKKLFKYVDLVNGVIVSTGVHAAGILCSDRDIYSEIGIATSKDTPFDVSMLDMHGLDDCFWVKLDLLGLDNVGVINKTCQMAGIERINPDNIDLEDSPVWQDITSNTTGIFQWEGVYATQILKQLFSESTLVAIRKKLPDIRSIKLFSFGNALIRPCGASVKDNAVKGIVRQTGVDDIDNMLANELGICIIQEDIMLFLMKFCGYDLSRADAARKCIAKKKGTEQLLPEIKQGFIENSKEKYNLSDKQVDDIIEPMLQCILDATRYAFSWNHSDAYSCIGYECGWLRYHYPVEFIAASLNVFKDKIGDTANLVKLAKVKGIQILPPRFGKSRGEYFADKDSKAIYKGIGSIKFLSDAMANQLYDISQELTNPTFADVLIECIKRSINSRVISILVGLDYFQQFGNAKELYRIIDIVDMFMNSKKELTKQIKKAKVENDKILSSIISRNCGKETEVTYLNINALSIIHEAEKYILSLNIPDFSIKEKMVHQQEYLGYISGTGKDEDRPILFINDITPLYRKKDNVQFGYKITTQSKGSGISSQFTIMNEVAKRCGILDKNTVIECKKWKRDERNPSWLIMTEYRIV